MTPARGYLVFVETVTGATVAREREPIGAVWILTKRDGSSFIDTARAEARKLYRLAGNQRAHCQLNTAIVLAVQHRRDSLHAHAAPGNGHLEAYSASYRAIMVARQERRAKAATRDSPAGRQRRSPGGVGHL